MLEVTIDLIKWFIAERESIRIQKDAGKPGPWTKDHVLANSKFCNIFRQDDKVSRWIFENCTNVKQVALARMINRLDLLEKMQLMQWSHEAFIASGKPYTNSAAYAFYPKKGETMATLIREIGESDVEKNIDKVAWRDDLDKASRIMSAIYDRSLHFYWFMVLLDCGQMGLKDITLTGKPYAGPGGHAVTKALGISLTELAQELNVLPFEAENIACETRKYVDRVNGGIQNNRKRKPEAPIQGLLL